jgi:hypothetical protein
MNRLRACVVAPLFVIVVESVQARRFGMVTCINGSRPKKNTRKNVGISIYLHLHATLNSDSPTESSSPLDSDGQSY